MLGAIVLLISACSRTTEPSGRSHSAAASLIREQDEAFVGHERSRVLTYDFGVLPPKAEASHRFVLFNNTREQWSAKRIVTTCRCTVVKLSPEVIPPGERAEAELEYRAPDKPGDDRKIVCIEFHESEARPILLEIQAKCRESLNAVPAVLQSFRVSRGTLVDCFFVLQNYSGDDIHVRSVAAADPWVDVAVHESGRSDADPELTQTWRVSVKLDTAKLAPGHHRSRVRVTTDSRKTPSLDVPVEISVVPPAEVSPPNLFFGAIASESSATRNLLLSLQGKEAVSESDIVLTHDMGSSFSVAMRETSPNVWLLATTLRPTHDQHDVIEGNLTIAFKVQQYPSLTVPIMAKVKR